MDPYKTLNVTKTASQDEIKSAYRKLAKKFHPDFNPGKSEAEKKFKEISSAYDLIGDSVKRTKFDRGEINDQGQPQSQDPWSGQERGGPQDRRGPRERRGQGSGSGPFYYESTQGGQSRYSGMEDIFETYFGGIGGKGRGSSQSSKGQDINYQMTVDFKDAALGAEREVTLANGKRISVKIPPGIETGKKLRFQGLGEAGRATEKPGDAYVEINVQDSPVFRRVGQDIEIDLLVSLAEAILGAEVKVPTLDGQIMMKIPSGVNSGAKLRVKGKGVARTFNSAEGRGDQLVTIKVMLPSTIDNDLREAIQTWSTKHPQEVSR